MWVAGFDIDTEPGGEPLSRASRITPNAIVLFVLATAAVCVLLLALPGQTVVTKYVNDLLIFLDGAHRVASGEVPNRDFHAALGPLVYYMPAAGLYLSGNLGGAMPVATALYIVALAFPIAQVLSTRLNPVLAIPFGAFLILILAVPINLGEGVTALSYGMFYNRVGWAALASLLVMYLRPERPRARQELFDAVSAAIIVVALVYTKVTFGVVAGAFVVFMLFDPGQRRWAALALAIMVAAAVVIEAAWRGSTGLITDLLLASKVSGVKGSIPDMGYAFLNNLADYVLFSLIAGIALWRMGRFRDLLFYGFCAVAGYLLIRQNFQNWGIITLHAGAVVAAETLVRSEGSSLEGRRWIAAGAPLLLLVLILPTTIHCAISLGLHAALATTRAGEDFGLPKFDRVRLANLLTPGDYIPSAKYLATLKDGAQALTRLDEPPSRVFVLDFVTPFSAGLGLEPPRHDSSWQHWERNFDDTHFVPPEQLFRDVRIVMEPKWPVEDYTYMGLKKVYGPYLVQNFEPVRETEYWTVYVRRDRRDQGIAARDFP
jgi:hypothetical protein